MPFYAIPRMSKILPLEPLEFRTPFAKIQFRNGTEIPVIVDPVWQRRLEGFSSSISEAIVAGSDDSFLLGLATADVQQTQVAQTADEQSLLALFSATAPVDYGPAIEDLKRQIAALESPQLFSDQALQIYDATVAPGIPQGLNTDSHPTFASLALSGLTPLSFVYSGLNGLLTATAAPTNGQLLIGDTAAAPVAANLTGTNHQIRITNGPGVIVLAAYQDLDVTSDVTFNSLTLTVPLPIASGGTDATTAAGAVTNLGLDTRVPSSLPVPITEGGTDATNASDALTNLGAAPDFTGLSTTLLTATTISMTFTNGVLTAST